MKNPFCSNCGDGVIVRFEEVLRCSRSCGYVVYWYEL